MLPRKPRSHSGLSLHDTGSAGADSENVYYSPPRNRVNRGKRVTRVIRDLEAPTGGIRVNLSGWKNYVSKEERAFALLAVWFMILALIALYIKEKEIVKLYTGLTFVSSFGILLVIVYSAYEEWAEEQANA